MIDVPLDLEESQLRALLVVVVDDARKTELDIQELLTKVTALEADIALLKAGEVA